MNENLENISLEKIADGALPLLFLEALTEEILPNIFDINVDPKVKRSITFTIHFKPTTDRHGNISGADIFVERPKCKLAPKEPIQSHALLGKIGNEYQAKVIKQMTLFDKTPSDENTLSIVRETV